MFRLSLFTVSSLNYTVLLVLTAAAFAQKAPLSLSLSSGRLTAINTSNQEVIAFVVKYDATERYETRAVPLDGTAPSPPQVTPGTATNTLSHDWYFKPHGIAVAETRELNGDLPPEVGEITKAKLLFTQSIDGSIWGDANTAKEMLAQRVPMKEFYQSLASSADQGEAAFLVRLNKETVFVGHAKHLLQIQKQSGTQAAIDMLRDRLNAASSRTF